MFRRELLRAACGGLTLAPFTNYFSNAKASQIVLPTTETITGKDKGWNVFLTADNMVNAVAGNFELKLAEDQAKFILKFDRIIGIDFFKHLTDCVHDSGRYYISLKVSGNPGQVIPAFKRMGCTKMNSFRIYGELPSIESLQYDINEDVEFSFHHVNMDY